MFVFIIKPEDHRHSFYVETHRIIISKRRRWQCREKKNVLTNDRIYFRDFFHFFFFLHFRLKSSFIMISSMAKVEWALITTPCLFVRYTLKRRKLRSESRNYLRKSRDEYSKRWRPKMTRRFNVKMIRNDDKTGRGVCRVAWQKYTNDNK